MALFLLIKFKNGETRKGHIHIAFTHTHTHTNTQLMEFMRAVDTVIKGEGGGIQCLRALERTCLT